MSNDVLCSCCDLREIEINELREQLEHLIALHPVICRRTGPSCPEILYRDCPAAGTCKFPREKKVLGEKQVSPPSCEDLPYSGGPSG